MLSKNSSGPKRAKPVWTTPEPVEEPVFSASSESLLSTVLKGDTETALKLIEDGADVNAEDQHGEDDFVDKGLEDCRLPVAQRPQNLSKHLCIWIQVKARALLFLYN